MGGWSSSGRWAGRADMAGVYQQEEASRWNLTGLRSSGGTVGADVGLAQPCCPWGGTAGGGLECQVPVCHSTAATFPRCRHLPPQPGSPGPTVRKHKHLAESLSTSVWPALLNLPIPVILNPHSSPRGTFF